MRTCVVALVLALAGRAVAQPSPVARVFSAGMTAYEKGDYPTAIAAFEEAFRTDPRPEVAFTLAQAHRNQYFADKDVTHLHRALGLYRHYLAESGAGRRAAHARLHLDTIEAILASLPQAAAPPIDKPQPTQLLVTADAPGARASIDGDAAAAIPRVVDVTAGTHRVRLEANGYDAVEVEALAVAERLVVVPASMRARPAVLVVDTDEAADITIDGRTAISQTKLSPGSHRIAVSARGRRPVVRDVELVETPRRRAARWTLYGAAGLGGAAGISAAIAWLVQRDAEMIYAARDENGDIDDYNAAVERRDSWRTVSIGLATTAGVAALTGVALWYFDKPRANEHAPAVAPLVGPESVGAAVFGRF